MFNSLAIAQLRKNKPGYQNVWSNDELLAGLNHFKELHGHYPSSHEVDDFPYLPSARSIQRTHGGLVGLRRELLPLENGNLTKGKYRSAVAKNMNKNGRDYETKFYGELVKHFEEISIHEHKVMRPGGVSCDFFIYLAEDDGVVVDIFYANSIKNLINVINIKLKRYVLINKKTYLVVVGNPNIDDEQLLKKMENRRSSLPDHVVVATEKYFFEQIVPKLQSSSRYALG